MTRSRRYLQAVAFVALWLAIGLLFHLDPNCYLLVGVPLVVLFQIGVRREPLVKLWVRDATHFRLGAWGILLALGLAALPALDLVRGFRTAPWAILLWQLCCIAGAVVAGFSLCRFTQTQFRALVFCLATAGVIGCAMQVGVAVAQKHSLAITVSRTMFCAKQFLLYFPVCFTLEDVVFRGAIDAHVHHPGEARPWWSAAFVSALWGLWHIGAVPIPGQTHVSRIAALIVLAVGLPLVHIPTGIFLSLGWRRSGNLAVPAMVHALIDAVRNTVLRV
jgi:membrane protease YdiL (CAAX protease family)